MRVAELNRLLARGRGRAFDRHEEELAEAVEGVLNRAADRAARRFRATATPHTLAAAAPRPTSAMVAVYPDPDEAVQLAQAGASETPDMLHVTLAFLGDLDPDQAETAASIVREVAGENSPLEGVVGGIASFDAGAPLRPDGEPHGAIFDVAQAHAPDGGYGHTGYHAPSGTVFWVSADWTSSEESGAAQDAFLEIDGVDRVDGEAEAALPKGDGWETVWTPGMRGRHPSILLPDVAGLAELRQAVCDALDRAGIDYSTAHGWTPHLTLDYTADPAPPPARLLGRPLTFDRLSFTQGDAPRDFLLGDPLTAAAPRACSCGHAYRDHLGDDGPCEIDGCSCKGYEADQAEAALVAAARPSMLTTYELTMGSAGGRVFSQASIDAGYREASAAEWPSEASLEDAGEVLYRDSTSGVFRLADGSIVYVGISHGWLRLQVSAPSRVSAAGTVSAFSERYPPLYRSLDDGEETVPITFWAYGPHGPVRRLRMVEASPWDAITGNYTAPVRDELAAMMDGFEPGRSGQLILWQGPPGTGKTWALRALASEWRDWAEFHYITDPDAFFVEHPDYMIDVLLADSYEELVVVDGEQEVVETDRGGKWRILILEDTGELLSAGAKEKYGQGLSRLLNVVDGLVGQGLRVLCLVTTNDELGDLHPAVKRPGRCAVALEFGPLTADEAAAWSGNPEIGAGTIAELYERIHGGDPALEDADDLVAAALVAAGADSQADWIPPLPDEVVDAAEIVAQLRGKTDPVRRAAVEAAMLPALDGIGLSFDVTNPYVGAVVEKTAAHVTFIAETTRLNVNRIVRLAYEEGLSIPATAAAIRSGMKASSRARSRMIARTEMTSLANGAALAATRIVRDATGLEYRKRWMTAAGAKHPRHDTYPGLDGQEQALDEPFDVGGALLQCPGDPDGPAEEVVNCRCAVSMVEGRPGRQKNSLDDLLPTDVTRTTGITAGGGLRARGDSRRFRVR